MQRGGSAHDHERRRVMDPRAFQERLLHRLAGSEPNHRPEHTRIGARSHRGTDPRLLAMMPRDARAAAVLIGLQEHAGEPAVLLAVSAGGALFLPPLFGAALAAPRGRGELHSSCLG
jgi:hypothetical protein